MLEKLKEVKNVKRQGKKKKQNYEQKAFELEVY